MVRAAKLLMEERIMEPVGECRGEAGAMFLCSLWLPLASSLSGVFVCARACVFMCVHVHMCVFMCVT